MIGGDYFSRNLKCMAFDARLVQIALQNGLKAEINLLLIMLKHLVTYFFKHEQGRIVLFLDTPANK